MSCNRLTKCLLLAVQPDDSQAVECGVFVTQKLQAMQMHEQMPYSQRYTNYVLLLIMLVALFNTCDRTIISVLVDDIKADLAQGLAASGD